MEYKIHSRRLILRGMREGQPHLPHINTGVSMNNHFKRIISLTVMLSMLFCAVASASDHPFYSDVQTSHWAYEYIEECRVQGVMEAAFYDSQTSCAYFQPDSSMDIAQLFTVLAKGFYPDLYGEYCKQYPAALYSYDAAAVRLFSDRGFSAENESEGAKLSRAMLARAILILMQDLGTALPSESELQSAAAAIGDWEQIESSYDSEYRQAIKAVYAWGIMNGVDEKGSFMADRALTRAQLAAVYCRLDEALEGRTFSQAMSEKGVSISEDDRIYASIMAMQPDYPEGLSWTNERHFRGYGCEAFCQIVVSRVFGDDAKAVRYTDKSCIRVGDILRINNNSHSVMVLQIKDGQLVICEGNYNGQMHWGRTLDVDSLDLSFGRSFRQ